jgi:hypothetical protein
MGGSSVRAFFRLFAASLFPLQCCRSCERCRRLFSVDIDPELLWAVIGKRILCILQINTPRKVIEFLVSKCALACYRSMVAIWRCQKEQLKITGGDAERIPC